MNSTASAPLPHSTPPKVGTTADPGTGVHLTLVNASVNDDKHSNHTPVVSDVNSEIKDDSKVDESNDDDVPVGREEVGKDACLVCNDLFQKDSSSSSGPSRNVPNEEESEVGSKGLLKCRPLSDNKCTFLDFCNLLKVGVPSTMSKKAWWAFGTPLCDKCMEEVIKMRRLNRQIEEMERSLAAARSLVKDKIVAHSLSECSEDNINIDQDLTTVTGIVFIVNRIRSWIRKDVSDSALHKKRGRKPGKKVRPPMLETDGATLTAAILKDSSRKSSFGRVVKRPRYFMMSDAESSAEVDDVEKKFDPNSAASQHLSLVKDVIPSDLVKVEMANNFAKAGGNSVSETTEAPAPTIVESKSEVEPKLNDSEMEFQTDTSNGNCSADGVGNQLDEDGTHAKKKIVTKKHLKAIQKRKSKLLASSTLISKRRKSVAGSFQKVKLVGVNGEDLGQSVIKEGKIVIGNGLQKHIVEGVEQVKVETKVENDELPKFKCEKCTRTFSDERKRERHIRKVHVCKGVKREYECKGCDKKFTKLKELSHHRKVEHPPKDPKVDATGRKLFQCDFCKVLFKNYCDLQIHHRLHTGEKPFKCSIDSCKDAFISKGRYEVHVEVKHPGKAPLKCDYCPRSFFRHHRLRDHKKSHTGEKPYLCEICSKAFTQPAYLKYHQTKHKELNLAEFKCDQCEKKFASPVNLKYHKETQHQKKYRYHCETCGHGATHMSHMKLHMRRHTGERPHTCPICQKTFTRGSQLKIHIRSHTGERPYQCPKCTKCFTNSSKLRRHETTHADNKVKRRQSIVKVTHLDQQNHFAHSSSTLASAALAGTSSGILVPAEVVVDDDTNGQAVLKLEHVPSSLTEQDFQQQLITIQQPNGVTYQIIASEDGISNETFAEYILINGDFTIG